MAKRHRVRFGMERWSAQTKGLSALKVGQHVTIQNQRGVGKIAKRWDRTGVVVEDLGFNKYRVRIDGSGRVTDRNRQFLRLFKPATFTYSPGITQNRVRVMRTIQSQYQRLPMPLYLLLLLQKLL